MVIEEQGKFTRKQFIVGLMGVGGSVVFGEVRKLELDGRPPVSKKSIEQEFRVRLLTARELYAEKGISYPENEKSWGTSLYKRDVPQAWTLEQLRTLRASLESLPQHFYQPNVEGERFGIVLSNRDCQCGSAYNETKPYRVELSYNRFKKVTRKADFVVLAHECTHVQTPVRGYRSVYSEIDRRTVQLEESPWYDELNKLLGGYSDIQTRALLRDRSYEVSKGLYAKLPDYSSDIGDKEEWEDLLRDTYTQDEQEQYGFFERLDDILWFPYRAVPEFVAFLAENYVQGKPYFERHLGSLLRRDEYDSIYNFTRQEIFKGKEYFKHPLV